MFMKAQTNVAIKMLRGGPLDTIKVMRMVVDISRYQMIVNQNILYGKTMPLLEVRQRVDTVCIDGEDLPPLHPQPTYMHIKYLTIYKTPLLFNWQVWEPTILVLVQPISALVPM